MMDHSLLFSLRLSIQVAAAATVLTGIAGLLLAYLLATRRFRGKELVDLVIMLPMVLPPVLTGCYLLVVIGRNGMLGRSLSRLLGIDVMFTWYAAVLAAAVLSLPLMVRTSRAAIESVDPQLIKASYTLGRSELQTALRVVLPLSRRGIAAGIGLAFARALGEFGATIMIAGNIPGRTNTMPLELYNKVIRGDWHQANVLALIFTGVSGCLILGANLLSRRGAW